MLDEDRRALLNEAAPGLPIAEPFAVGPIAGLTPALGQLASMMTYARATTLMAIDGLSIELLDTRFDEHANSIGMLLEHVACLEEFYQLDTFGWAMPDPQMEAMEVGMELGARARDRIRGHDLAWYRSRLADVRRRTLLEFAMLDDRWLFAETNVFGDNPGNTYFKWFHVCEDELSHRGQIRWLRRRLEH